MHTRRAVEAVAIEEGDGGDFQFQGTLDEVLGLGGSFEKREGAGGVELNIVCNGVGHIFFSGIKAWIFGGFGRCILLAMVRAGVPKRDKGRY
jgi:hypothetical protein